VDFGQVELRVSEGGGDISLVSCLVPSDCCKRGRPVPYIDTVNRAHRANARDVTH
jgi:hypothetical protein